MPRDDYKPRTPFQEWLNAALRRKGINLTDLAALVDSDYTHIWKIGRGNPVKYPTSRRPGYELTVAIGTALNDLEGALVAAEWKTPESASGTQQLTRLPDMKIAEVMELYNGLPSEAARIAAAEGMEAVVTSIQRLSAKAVGTIGRGEDPENMTVEDITDDESQFEE